MRCALIGIPLVLHGAGPAGPAGEEILFDLEAMEVRVRLEATTVLSEDVEVTGAGRTQREADKDAREAMRHSREAAEARIDSPRRNVCARVQGELKLIPIADIAYFNADQKYVCVHHAKGTDLIDDSLKSLEEEFAEHFVRIHRSALVAVEKIEKLEKAADGKTYVVLRNTTQDEDNAPDDELVISRRHLATVRRRLKGG